MLIKAHVIYIKTSAVNLYLLSGLYIALGKIACLASESQVLGNLAHTLLNGLLPSFLKIMYYFKNDFG